MSRAVMLITVTGRRTGRSYTLPVQYARAGFVLYVIPGNPRGKTWWRNLIGGAPVTLRLSGRDVEASAAVLNGGHAPDREEVEEGMRVLLARFPAAARAYGIRRNPDRTLDEESLRAAIGSIMVVVVTPES
jgi:F420H(2)-dependent quinone reductase